MPPNIQLSWIKISIEQNKSSSLKIKCRIARNEIWFIDRRPRKQTYHSCEILTFIAVILSVQFIFLCFYHFWQCIFQSWNTIFRPEQCRFKKMARELFCPFTKRRNAKPKQSQNSFRHSIEKRSIINNGFIIRPTLHKMNTVSCSSKRGFRQGGDVRLETADKIDETWLA